MFNLKTTALIMGFLSTTGTTAFAHATLEQSHAVAGKTAKIVLRVPHGCNGEATHTVRIDLPEGFYNAKPMPKAGWTLETETGAYETPYNNHGKTMESGVRTITWSGGHLESDWYDEFTFRGTVGPNVAAETVMYFPALQTCANGVADWTNTSGEKGGKNPSPKLTVVAGEMSHASHQNTMGDHVVGDLHINGAFSRETLPNAPVAGGFFTVTNKGQSDDRLIGATSNIAGRVEIHEMAMENDVMKMRELPDGLSIPAGATVELKPGGYHIMFMDLNTGLSQGDTVTVTLEFEKAGKTTLTMPVEPRQGAMGNMGGAMGHGGQSGHQKHGG